MTLNEPAFQYALERNRVAGYADSERTFREFVGWYLEGEERRAESPTGAQEREVHDV